MRGGRTPPRGVLRFPPIYSEERRAVWLSAVLAVADHRPTLPAPAPVDRSARHSPFPRRTLSNLLGPAGHPHKRYQTTDGLAAAGFTDITITPSHQVADGMRSASIRATNPTPPCTEQVTRPLSGRSVTSAKSQARSWSHLWSHSHAFIYVHWHSHQCGDAGHERTRHSANYCPEF